MKSNVLDKLDLREVISLNVKFIQFFGYFCPDCKTALKVAYYIYSFLFVGFILILFAVSETINMIVVFGDIEKMSEASFLFLTHLVQASKLYIFVVHHSKVWRLINSINREVFEPKNYDQYKLLADDINVSKKQTKIFLLMGFATCTLWGVFPLLDKHDGRKNIRLPLSGWFPFNTDNSPAFECAYMYLSSAAMINGLANISMDSFLAGVIMVVSGQLKILNNSFQILKHECERKPKDAIIYHSGINKELIKNIVHHKNIIQFADAMTDLFTNCIMGQFVISVVIICITMFQMSLVSVASFQFLSMLLYQGCIVLEIFLWCYYGNEVILESGKLTQSAYMCEWVDCPKEFKNNLLYFMTRSQIMLKLYAGGYFTLSLDTFIAIVKSSWSYFAVLNRVHSS